MRVTLEEFLKRLMEDKMYATLEEFLKLSKENQAKVTWLDLTFATEDDRAKMRSRENPYLGDAEEYEGERVDRGLL